ncbi:peptidyl-prolyl cis-trans isomerase FKBP8 [Anopheles aquasalis]|uniref:peptidyl-prolyl cis-trans isomerase FKBP8 n=1 Tax=Anopheles aquasalis TaxID=42839 RepID=UPI00215B0D69|nr:peptidyl-prolyl cis-trans isomerase FKBP8 [Anopheles aquasalis]XP_050096125.1 peptidyl-prolyl cis-trans isomerase FKBP8 [Anopheles aquasalis]XP_050096126.1 peptidyl-prolyl cis-trans isomerase FKBP8 [Anopheles aquasalis]XP_050096127.1 peptidyl-prolyl cis-trans isomerase FKBP8 [Anopheles aquasalis]XP_050096128.1 peptidyl-prolyl cis-trans isomerase FKBP8 [Anopheles aquasalis]
MDAEKSSSSSFEDLSNLNEQERAELAQSSPSSAAGTSSAQPPLPEDLKKDAASSEEEGGAAESSDYMDILGNGTLLKKVLRKGLTEMRPESKDIATISYTGRLEDGTIVEEEHEAVVQIDDVEVVQGLDMALKLMNEGEQAEVVVNPRFAYGEIGLKNETDPKRSIPPNATITYTVELLSTKEESELESRTYTSRKEIGNKKRLRGNFWMKRQEYNLAIQSYRRALEYLDDTVSAGGMMESGTAPPAELTTTELQDLLEDRMKVYNNLALAQLKISAYQAALKSVDTVLKCQPNNAKALFRKGKIHDAQGDTKAAIALLQKAATVDVDDKLIQSELSKLILKSKREARNEKDLYQKMLGQAQKLEQKTKVTPPNQTTESSKLKMWGYLVGAILIGVAGVAIYRYNIQ